MADIDKLTFQAQIAEGSLPDWMADEVRAIVREEMKAQEERLRQYSTTAQTAVSEAEMAAHQAVAAMNAAHAETALLQSKITVLEQRLENQRLPEA